MVELGWLAGYFDAKVTITRKMPHGKTRHARLMVWAADSNRVGLDRLAQEFGGRIESWNGGRAYRWVLEGNPAIRCLEMLAPLLVIKHTRAREALACKDTPELLTRLTRGAL